MLNDRLRSSTILLVIVSALIYCDATLSPAGAGGIWLLPLLLLFALGTAADVSAILAGSGRRIARVPVLAATLIVACSAAIPLAWPLAGAVYPPNCPVGRFGWSVLAGVLAVFVILLREMRFYGLPQAEPGTIERTCCGVFVSLYVGLPMAVLVATRMLGEGNWGLAALLTTIAVTKSADAALLVGKPFGRHKLVQRLSPKKSWEGLIGGIITATLVAFVMLAWGFPAIADGDSPPGRQPPLAALANPIYGALWLGPLLTLSGLIGDLGESLVKRDAGVKDSGSLLPGLGGVWDVTDSLIAASMPAFLSFTFGVGW